MTAKKHSLYHQACTSANPRILTRLSRHANPAIRIALLHNPAITRDILLRMAQDESWRVRWALANLWPTPTFVLATLCHDPDSRIRLRIAQVTKDSQALNTMAHDREDAVRWAVGANPASAFAVLQVLAHDPSATVRTAAADNLQSTGLSYATPAIDSDQSI